MWLHVVFFLGAIMCQTTAETLIIWTLLDNGHVLPLKVVVRVKAAGRLWEWAR